VSLSVILILLALYLPVAWIPFCDRAKFAMADKYWVAFVLTLPGEWYAQRCGARSYDYFFFAGLATACLFAFGAIIGKRAWTALAGVVLLLAASSAMTALWLWNDLSW
jgi:hypothetical protein